MIRFMGTRVSDVRGRSWRNPDQYAILSLTSWKFDFGIWRHACYTPTFVTAWPMYKHLGSFAP